MKMMTLSDLIDIFMQWSNFYAFENVLDVRIALRDFAKSETDARVLQLVHAHGVYDLADDLAEIII